MNSLHVEDPEAYRLAEAITKVTGESMAHAVAEALRERFDRLKNRRRKASLDELRAIASRAAAYVKHPHLDHAQYLYDESGLPK